MKELDRFNRFRSRQYDRPAKEESRLADMRRFNKRSFDIGPLHRFPSGAPFFKVAISVLIILWLCNASVPLGEVPSAQERFIQWAQVQNERTIQNLPGNTPEPESEMAKIINFSQTEQQTEIQNEIEAQVQAEQKAGTSPETAETTTSFKEYAKGELEYHTDKMSVSIEQKKKDGLTYYVCDIQLTDVSQLRTAFAGDDFKSGIYEAVSSIAGRYSPVLAINADFCRYHRNGVIIRNGELLRKQNITKHHLMIVDENGDMSVLTNRTEKQGLVADRLMKSNTWQTFEFGPVLVENGEATTLPNSFYVNTHDGYNEPRTAVGQIGPLHYMVIVVDGRREGYSTGCSIPKLQELFMDEHVQFAFNLDGGGSTTLYFLGKVINMPSGGKERSVSDILMFMPNPVKE